MDARVDERRARTEELLRLGIPDPARTEELLFQLMRGINAVMLPTIGTVIRHGPFKGMMIPGPEQESWMDGNFSTKIFGTYEHELHSALAYAATRKPAVLVNVGCGDGYYAIGLARLIHELNVYAFDLNEAALDTCRELAKPNGVSERIAVAYGCETPEDMRCPGALGNRLYVIDCEGDERKLVDPQRCPELVNADIIVECHDFLDGGISLLLSNRLAATHSIEVIAARLPLYARYEFLAGNPSIVQVLALTEKRPSPTLWLACWAHRKGDASG